MKFTKLSFKNFLSYGNKLTTIDLDVNKTVLISGENGTGKTTALEAFFYNLTGKPFRKVKLAELINTTNKKELYTEVEFEHQGKTFLIRRGMKPNIFEIYQDQTLINLDSKTKDYQKILENLIGVDSKTFANTIFISSKQYTPFMKLEAADKRNFIENVLNIKKFSEILEQVKIKRSLQNETHNSLEFQLKNAKDKLAVAKESNEKYAKGREEEKEKLLVQLKEKDTELESLKQEETRIKEWAESSKIEESIKEINLKIKAKEQEKSNIQESINKLIEDNYTEKKKINQQIANTIDAIHHQDKKQSDLLKEVGNIQRDLQNDLKQIQDDIKKAEKESENTIFNEMIKSDSEKKAINNRIADYKKQVEFYKHNSTCPTCKQNIDQDSDIISKHIEELNGSIKDEEVKINQLIISFDTFKVTQHKLVEQQISLFRAKEEPIRDEYIKKIAENNKNIELLKKDIEKIREEQKELKEQESKLDERLRSEKYTLSEKLSAIDEEIEAIRVSNQTNEKNYNKAQTRLSVIESEIRSINKNKDQIQETITEIDNTKKVDFISTDGIEKDIEQAQITINDSEYKKETINEMIKILSDKGIKSYIIAKYSPFIASLCNKYLEIFGASYRVSFDDQFDITIHGKGYDKLGYGSFSSGEEQRLDLSLLWAFFELGKSKNSINTNLILLDEISDKSLDSSGLDGMFIIFEQLKRRGMSIFNITHRPEIKDRFDMSYRTEKQMFSQLIKE